MRKATSLITVTGALLALSPTAHAAIGADSAGAITVTAPGGHVTKRSNDSLVVRWHNTTGDQVDIWLSGKGPGGSREHLAQLASRAGQKEDGELMVQLPHVVKGTTYTIEVASPDGKIHATSHDFAMSG